MQWHGLTKSNTKLDTIKCDISNMKSWLKLMTCRQAGGGGARRGRTRLNQGQRRHAAHLASIELAIGWSAGVVRFGGAGHGRSGSGDGLGKAG
jgi:hypothetical protein